jgi:hypothetical protein
MFKTYEQAREKFDLMVKNAKRESEITSEGVTGNAEKY